MFIVADLVSLINSLIMHVRLSRRARGLNVRPSLYLCAFFVRATSEGSVAALTCDKYQNLMNFYTDLRFCTPLVSTHDQIGYKVGSCTLA